MSMMREILTRAVAAEASDIHITVGNTPLFRIHGELQNDASDALDVHTVQSMVTDVMPNYLRADYEETHEETPEH